MKSTMEQGYSAQLGEEVSLENFAFESTDIDGCPAYKMSYDLTINGVTISQTVIGVNGDKAYTYSFTDMTGEWGDAFAAAIDSMTAVQVA